MVMVPVRAVHMTVRQFFLCCRAHTDNLNIKRTVVATRKSGKVAIEIQIDGKADVADLREKLLNQGIQVDAIELTEAKSLD